MLFDYTFADYTLSFGKWKLHIRGATNFEACVDQMFAKQSFTEEECPYGAALWPAAVALGNALYAQPDLVRGKRTLELGCGLGLGAIIAKRLGADVTASDFHPDMKELFETNCELNGVRVPYLRLDWADFTPREPYETIIASDVLYDSRIAPLCLDVLQRLLVPGGTIVLTDPQRGQLTRMREGLTGAGFSWREVEQKVEFADQNANCIVFYCTR